MRIPKRYGQSKVDMCPFCERQATAVTKQGVPVCQQHKHARLNDLKCICGEYVDPRQGKYGLFFNCMTCGPVSPAKIFELNEVWDASAPANMERKEEPKRKQVKHEPKEFTVTSDDPRYFL